MISYKARLKKYQTEQLPLMFGKSRSHFTNIAGLLSIHDNFTDTKTKSDYQIKNYNRGYAQKEKTRSRRMEKETTIRNIFDKDQAIFIQLDFCGYDDEEKMANIMKDIQLVSDSKIINGILLSGSGGRIRLTEIILNKLKKYKSGLLYGINISDYRRNYELAKTYEADFILINSILGNKTGRSNNERELDLKRLRAKHSTYAIGEYKPPCPNSKKEAKLENIFSVKDEEINQYSQAVSKCDALAVAYNSDIDTNKLIEMRSFLRNCKPVLPLIINKGVTVDNANLLLNITDGIILGEDFLNDKPKEPVNNEKPIIITGSVSETKILQLTHNLKQHK